MPWRSKEASKRAVRGCFGSAGKDAKKRRACSKMAHEARLWRGNKRKSKRMGKGHKRVRK